MTRKDLSISRIKEMAMTGEQKRYLGEPCTETLHERVNEASEIR